MSTEATPHSSSIALDPVDVAAYLPAPGRVTLLSATWCGHCSRLKTMLSRTGIEFTEVMVEDDPVAERLAIEANGGDWLIPTVIYADGTAGVNPGLAGVRDRLHALDNGVSAETSD